MGIQALFSPKWMGSSFLIKVSTYHSVSGIDKTDDQPSAQAIKLTPPPLGMDAFPRIKDTMSLRYLDRFYSV